MCCLVCELIEKRNQVEDLFKMYQEMNNYMNNYVSNEPEYTPEWPFDYGLGYCDEGMEESYYG